MRKYVKLGYGIGQTSAGVKNAAFSIFLFFYYNQVLGLSGSLAGMASLLALIIDAITDPMVGQLSDRFKSRWGRRHPFMLIGAVPFGFAMYLLFAPPAGMDEYGLFAWMLGFAITVRVLLTFFFVPHLSLGAEMVRDYHERTSLISYRLFFQFAGGLFVTMVGFVVFFPPSDGFPERHAERVQLSGFWRFLPARSLRLQCSGRSSRRVRLFRIFPILYLTRTPGTRCSGLSPCSGPCGSTHFGSCSSPCWYSRRLLA